MTSPYIELNEYIANPFSSHRVQMLTAKLLKETAITLVITILSLFVVGCGFYTLPGKVEPVMAALILLALPAILCSSYIASHLFPETPRAITLGDDTLAIITADDLMPDIMHQQRLSSPQARQLYKAIRLSGRPFYTFEVNLIDAIERRFHRDDPALNRA